MATNEDDAARELQRAARKEKARIYREANAEKIRDYKRAWLAANPERHRKHSRDAAARLRRRKAQRAKDRERVRRWREANPERVRERQRAWNAANADRRKEIDRNSYHRNKDRRLEAMRERNAARRRDPVQVAKQKAYRKANREHLNELQRQRRALDPEASRRDQRERKQREKRRIELGLPKVPLHRTLKNERLANERDATAFFERPRDKAARDQLNVEAGAVSFISSRTQWRARVAAEEMSQRVLYGVVAHTLAPQRIAAQIRTMPAGEREVIRMDLIARRARGGPPVDVDTELRHRVTRHVLTKLAEEAGMPIYIPKDARTRTARHPAPPTERGPSAGTVERGPMRGSERYRGSARDAGAAGATSRGLER